EDRELHHFQSQGAQCQWATHQPNLFCENVVSIQPGAEAADLMSISVDSGQAKQLGALHGFYGRLLDVRDDSALYLLGRVKLVRWEIGSRQETTLDQKPAVIGGAGFWWRFLSPDGRWVTQIGGGKIPIRPIEGGDWK